MSQSIIDLSGFDRMGYFGTATASDVEITRQSTSVVKLDSKTAPDGMIEYIIPGPLPPGAKITAICETKFVSGDRVRLQFRSATANNYTTGESVENQVDGTDQSEFIESSVTTTVAPGRQFYKVLIGYDGGRIGSAELRGFRLVIDGVDLLTVKPDQMVAPNHSRVWTASELQSQWVKITAGGGSITDNADSISMVAPAGSTARIVYSTADTDSAKNLTALKQIDGSKGFTVSVRGTRNSGLPAIFATYTNGQDPATTLSTLRGFVISNDDEWSTHWFPPVNGSSFAWLEFGFKPGINDGSFEIKQIKIEQFGVAQQTGLSLRPFICQLVWQSANTGNGKFGWSINEINNTAPGNAASSTGVNIGSLTSSAIQLEFDNGGSYTPIPIVQCDGNGLTGSEGERSFHPAVTMNNSNTVQIAITRINTGDGTQGPSGPNSRIDLTDMVNEVPGQSTFAVNIIAFGVI